MAEPANPFAAFADLTLPYLEDTLGVFYIGYAPRHFSIQRF
jgi:hypothetical protein